MCKSIFEFRLDTFKNGSVEFMICEQDLQLILDKFYFLYVIIGTMPYMNGM